MDPLPPILKYVARPPRRFARYARQAEKRRPTALTRNAGQGRFSA